MFTTEYDPYKYKSPTIKWVVGKWMGNVREIKGEFSDGGRFYITDDMIHRNHLYQAQDDLYARDSRKHS